MTAQFWQLIWRSWAPLNIKFFLWLASQNHCWTADRLARRGMQHNPVCGLCSQEDETLHHILVGCTFSRVTWHEVVSWCRLPMPTPDGTVTFFSWWSDAAAAAPHCLRKGFASLVIITSWAIWKHRNAIIFEAAQPSHTQLLSSIKDEARRWGRAGAKGLAAIIPVT